MRTLNRKLQRGLTVAGMVLTAAALYDQICRTPEYRDWHGVVFGIPYDFRPPTVARIRSRYWNRADPRILTPHVCGVGWSVNLVQVLGRVPRGRH